MKKLKILLILLLIVGCNKTEKIDKVEIQDTSATVEQQPLTEEEAWKLFDEFWVEFQKAVVEGDEEAIREMCELGYDEFNNLIENLILYCKKYQKLIKKADKNNNYGETFKPSYQNSSVRYFENWKYYCNRHYPNFQLVLQYGNKYDTARNIGGMLIHIAIENVKCKIIWIEER